MKVLLKDESLWPCAFSPLTFTTEKLDEFVKVAIGFGKIHTCYEWFEMADNNKRGFLPKRGLLPIPISSKVLTRFLPLLNLSEDGFCNLKEQMQMFILSIFFFFFFLNIAFIEKEIEQPNLAKTPRAVAPRRLCQPGRNEKQ